MKSWARFGLELLVIFALVVGAYYQLSARVIILEHGINQELQGYKVLVESFGSQLREINTRLSRIEGKLENQRRYP